ncbi:hypothetical protein D3C77_421970 [compost metagenome]
MGNRAKDFQCLICNAALALFRLKFERPHVMQTVCELNDNNPDVLCHGNEHFPVVFILLFFLGLKLNALQLRQPVHKHGAIAAKVIINFFQGNGRIFNYIMKQGRNNRECVHLHAHDNFRNR